MGRMECYAGNVAREMISTPCLIREDQILKYWALGFNPQRQLHGGVAQRFEMCHPFVFILTASFGNLWAFPFELFAVGIVSHYSLRNEE